MKRRAGFAAPTALPRGAFGKSEGRLVALGSACLAGDRAKAHGPAGRKGEQRKFPQRGETKLLAPLGSLRLGGAACRTPRCEPFGLAACENNLL